MPEPLKQLLAFLVLAPAAFELLLRFLAYCLAQAIQDSKPQNP